MPRFKLTGPKGGLLVRSATLGRVAAVLPGLVRRFNHVTVQANPAPIKGPVIPAHVPAPTRTRMVAWAHWSVEHASSFVYTEAAARSEMFHRTPGDLSGKIRADCSQWYVAVGHWCGVAALTDTDYTGTLLQKGTLVRVPKPGDVAVFGPGTGTHAAMVTERQGSDWWTIGFGHQGGPDRVLLTHMKAYFDQAGKPGVRFLAFTP